MPAIGTIAGHQVQAVTTTYAYGNAIAAGSTIMLLVQNVGTGANIISITDQRGNTYNIVAYSNNAANGNDTAFVHCKVAAGKDIQVGDLLTVTSGSTTDEFDQIVRADYWTVSLDYVSSVLTASPSGSSSQDRSMTTTNTTQKLWCANQKFTSATPSGTYTDGNFVGTNSTTRSSNANAAVTGYYEPSAVGTFHAICSWAGVTSSGYAGMVMLDNSASASVPGAPTDVSATPGNGSAQVTFTAPGSDGGSAITGYTATSSPGGHTGSGSSSPVTVNGLTNGTPYTFTVHATNAVGNSAESAPSSAVTPSTVPGAPRNVTAAAGDTEATVTFDPPTSDGGATIDHYTITASPGGATAVVTP